MTRDRGVVDVGDGELYFERDGRGSDVLLIHGFSLSAQLWEPQIDAFSQRFSFLRCDLRGYGRSTLPTGPYRHCDDVRALLDHLEIGQVCIGGQSYGGTVALDFAFAYPERVSGLILAPALPLPGWEWVEEFPLASAVNLIETEGVDAAKAAFAGLPLHASVMENAEAAASLERMLNEWSGWQWRNRDPGTLEAPDAVGRLAEVRVPALVIVGGRDVYDARLVAEHLAAKLPDAEHHLIDHVGHIPNLEDAALFNDLVGAFVANIEA